VFVEMELGKRLVVRDPDGDFSVTAYDANHCPGNKYISVKIQSNLYKHILMFHLDEKRCFQLASTSC
jgi:Cft2 family RNA processing exonuclease